MKKVIFLLALSLLASSCYKEDIRALHQELDNLQDVVIPSLSEQASNINSSVAGINSMNAELVGLLQELSTAKSSMDAKLAEADQSLERLNDAMMGSNDETVNELLALLQTIRQTVASEIEDAEAVIGNLDRSANSISDDIEGLKSFIDSLYARKDWAQATMATLAIQDTLLKNIETVRAQLEVFSSSTEELNTSMERLIRETFAKYNDDASAMITDQFAKLTQEYEACIAEMVEKISSENTQSILNACSYIEESMTAWVNTKLNDYYTIEAANAQIAAFNAILGSVPDTTSLQEEITHLQNALNNAQSDITTAYGKAINDAIESNNATLRKAMADSIATVRTALQKLNDKIPGLQSDVESLKKEMLDLEERIKTLEQQKEEIDKSISKLESLSTQLDEYIDALNEELAKADSTDRAELEKLIKILTDSADAIQKKIDELTAYVGELPVGAEETDIATWIKNTFATLNESFDNYKTATEVEEIVKLLESRANSQSGRLTTLSTDIEKFVTDIKTNTERWISDALEPYYTSADIDAKIKTLRDKLDLLYDKQDDSLSKVISQCESAFDKKVDSLTTKYKNLIQTAVNREGGYITVKIRDAIKQDSTEIVSLQNRVLLLHHDLDSLQDDVDDYKQLCRDMDSTVNALKTMLGGTEYNSLKELADALEGKIDSLKYTFNNKAEFDALYSNAKKLYGQTSQIDSLVDRMKEVTESLDLIKGFFGDYINQDLDSVLTFVTDSIASINMTIYGDGKNVLSLQNKIDTINVALYGKGGTADKPKEGSVMYLLGYLSDQLAADTFSSITYIPKFLDQKETMYFDANGLYGSFDFLVKPASIAKLANTSSDLFKMHFVSGGTDYEFGTQSVSGSDDGTITVSVRDARTTLFKKDGNILASAALYVNGKSDTVCFTSKYIFLKISGEANFYSDSTSLHFATAGETKTIQINSASEFYCSSMPEWITVDPSSLNGTASVSIRAYPNPDKNDRRGTVVFNSNGSIIEVTVEQTGCTGIYSPDFPFNGKIFKVKKGRLITTYSLDFTLVNEQYDAGFTNVYISYTYLSAIILQSSQSSNTFTYSQNNSIAFKNGQVTLSVPTISDIELRNENTLTLTTYNPTTKETGSSLTLTVVRNWDAIEE